MVDQETNEEIPTAKRIKQTISIPFLWEEKPGTPKIGWKRVNPIMQMPIKLIASVPFMWEEKPGTPLAGPLLIQHASQEPKIINPFEGSDSDSDSAFGHNHVDHENLVSESELGFISSSPNNQVASHKNNNPFCDSSSDDDENEYGLHAPSSPAWETESIASSYNTEMTASTLAGSSFLESMFPLMTKKSTSVADRGSRIYNNNCCTQIVSYDDADERKAALTLGEMIMMSRRRSFLKRAVNSFKHDHSTELMMMNGFGCCGIDIGGLHKLKRQMQLRLL